MKLPDRWIKYKDSGRIKGTPFVAFKVPLKQGYSRTLHAGNRFTPRDLLEKYPKIKLVVDLTDTTKYYNGSEEFEKIGVQYVKLRCRGLALPTEENFTQFVDIVEGFLKNNSEDCLIGVHCTHGVNRTGYFVVRYMIERTGCTPERALQVFCKCRGHAMERTLYIGDLLKLKSQQHVQRQRQRVLPKNCDDQIMPGDDISTTFKRCRSAINVNDPTLRKIAQEINLAEMLLLQYLKEMTSGGNGAVPSQNLALDHLSQLIIRELEYLRRVKNSEVVSIAGSFVTFRGDDGEFLVTVVPDEELQRNFHPLFSFGSIKPRFAKPVSSCESLSSHSAESVYYDACYDLPTGQSSAVEGTSNLGRSIHGLLGYIFASTIGKMDAADEPKP